MKIENTRIVADSSSDLLSLDTVPFCSAPLKIMTAEREFVDDENLDVREMVDYLASFRGRSSTSCPNPEDWIRAFGDAEFVFCITITGTLSGSHNAAVLAKKQYEEEHPDRRVFVLNSLSTGPEMALIVDRIRRCIIDGMDFDEVCQKTQEYHKRTGLLFVLESMKNLANNGRVSPLAAKMAGILGIRAVGRASERGDLEMLDKCRGEKKMLECVVARLKEFGLKNGRVRIAHCFNESTASALKELILSRFEHVRVELAACRGLCSFYAERGGMLIGFETGEFC